MSDQDERRDPLAEGYERHWAPVLAPSALALLDRAETVITDGARTLLDVGVGTGNLSIPALARWPGIRVTGIDPSPDMIDTVRLLVRERLPDAVDRFEGQVAAAAELPFEDGAFDAAISSFVLQLVGDRPAALREIRRVLRPGGRFLFVTWIADARAFPPDRIFDALLDELGFENEADPPRSGDFVSVGRAAAELRRAGFRDVTATEGILDHAFSVESYMAFLTEFDEESLFEDMGRAERRRVLIKLRERLMGLDPTAFRFRVPIVYASGRRP